MTVIENVMKTHPDDEDEIQDVRAHVDQSFNHVTPVALWPKNIAQYVVDHLAGTVRAAHHSKQASNPDDDYEGITRAQKFEEGDVYMLAAPYDGFFADRYLMDFYDVDERDICSRMHMHTGIRFVRMMTGLDTYIRVGSLTPFNVTNIEGVTPFVPKTFTDDLPDEPGIVRYNLIIPPCAWVDMQVPRGQSHQFNAVGPNAVIDSVHPEESIETFREHMSGFKMMAQTIFLAEERPPSETCDTLPSDVDTKPATTGANGPLPDLT